ncbi:NADH dehydrogenase [ubiquinone] 1 alpha subcomplex subunit 3 [Dasypus novemcinctus]|uniref:NADH dehydrogenase [ubiquinone] 1 alpha subcomplex subunit 3 n=1 Tax=Dasypus novemcinctus TaxID=9361 RepID=UPI00265F085F|nr:NADH dehydrogenase [ubiquinone] 1 alpha subcomplex subunit 3 [Dasypus novemcinctus]
MLRQEGSKTPPLPSSSSQADGVTAKPRILNRRNSDHNSQSAPRPRCRRPPLERLFCASAHAQTQAAAPGVHGPQLPGCSLSPPPPLPPPPRPRWLRKPPPSSRMPGPRSRCWLRPFTIAGLAVILPSVSPYTKYASMINQATPYNYPVPVRDDGNMLDVPSHPQDPQGRSLEWLKNL